MYLVNECIVKGSMCVVHFKYLFTEPMMTYGFPTYSLRKTGVFQLTSSEVTLFIQKPSLGPPKYFRSADI